MESELSSRVNVAHRKLSRKCKDNRGGRQGMSRSRFFRFRRGHLVPRAVNSLFFILLVTDNCTV